MTSIFFKNIGQIGTAGGRALNLVDRAVKREIDHAILVLREKEIVKEVYQMRKLAIKKPAVRRPIYNMPKENIYALENSQ